jgi:hypothetical protein
MVLQVMTATACRLHRATWLKASTLVTITDHGRSDGTAIDTPIAGRREWIGLMVLGLANLLYVMDLTVLKLAVPAISVGLQPSSTQLLLELFWWGSVFLVALPVAALLLVLGPRVLPEERDVEAGRLDLPSATMPVVAVLATIYGLKQVVQDGLDLLPAGCIVAGLAVGGGFVRRQRTLADPVIDVGLFRITTFSAAPAVNFLAIFVIVGSQLGPRLAGRVRPANTIAAGLALGAVGLVMLTQLGAADGLALLVIGSLIISLGFAPVFGFATELVVGSAPPQRAGRRRPRHPGWRGGRRRGRHVGWPSGCLG